VLRRESLDAQNHRKKGTPRQGVRGARALIPPKLA